VPSGVTLAFQAVAVVIGAIVGRAAGIDHRGPRARQIISEDDSSSDSFVPAEHAGALVAAQVCFRRFCWSKTRSGFAPCSDS